MSSGARIRLLALLATRVLAAPADAGFLAVDLAAVTGMVAPDAEGRATAVLLGGTTPARAVGVPAGAVLGQLLGRRLAFWAVALLSAPAFAAIARSVPRGPADAAGPDRNARTEPRAPRRPRLRSVLGLAALVHGAAFRTFPYPAPLVTEVRLGAGPAVVPAGRPAGRSVRGPAGAQQRPAGADGRRNRPARRVGPHWLWSPGSRPRPSPWYRSSVCWPSGSARC
ncbi:MFS transporter [Streptomyces flaveolus]|uniref:MFS transporter n=1 Tax=Streptomyces flaveolus TaxID=67297 RepID=UPI0033BF51D4